jgi:FAD binding domain-containing protein/uncharacterized protein DUF3500
VTTARIRYLDRGGRVLHEQAQPYRFSNWNTVYHSLLRCFGRDRYSLGRECVTIEPAGDEVRLRFAGGEELSCDLLVCADGIGSRARARLLPEARPRYAGYVAWRGLVAETELGAGAGGFTDAITYHVFANSHVLVYPIPGLDGALEPGRRLINFVWVPRLPGRRRPGRPHDSEGVRHEVSMPPGKPRAEHQEEMRATAAARLLPAMAAVVHAVERPFLQSILDIEVPRMAFGRVCLVGDAVFAVRPTPPPAPPRRRPTAGRWPRRSSASRTWSRRSRLGNPGSSSSDAACSSARAGSDAARRSTATGRRATPSSYSVFMDPAAEGVAARMAPAAHELLETLDGDQRGDAAWPFRSDDERRRWYHTPTDHGGLAHQRMRPHQQQLAFWLLATGLSRPSLRRRRNDHRARKRTRRARELGPALGPRARPRPRPLLRPRIRRPGQRRLVTALRRPDKLGSHDVRLNGRREGQRNLQPIPPPRTPSTATISSQPATSSSNRSAAVFGGSVDCRRAPFLTPASST